VRIVLRRRAKGKQRSRFIVVRRIPVSQPIAAVRQATVNVYASTSASETIRRRNHTQRHVRTAVRATHQYQRTHVDCVVRRSAYKPGTSSSTQQQKRGAQETRETRQRRRQQTARTYMALQGSVAHSETAATTIHAEVPATGRTSRRPNIAQPNGRCTARRSCDARAEPVLAYTGLTYGGSPQARSVVHTSKP